MKQWLPRAIKDNTTNWNEENMNLFLGSFHYAINKQKTINGDLHSSKRISSNFDEEIPLIKERLMKAD